MAQYAGQTEDGRPRSPRHDPDRKRSLLKRSSVHKQHGAHSDRHEHHQPQIQDHHLALHSNRFVAGFRTRSSVRGSVRRSHIDVSRKDGEHKRMSHLPAHGSPQVLPVPTLDWNHGCPVFAEEEASTFKAPGPAAVRYAYERASGSLRSMQATTIEAALKKSIVSTVWRLAQDVKLGAKTALRQRSIVVTFRKLAARSKARDTLEDELIILSQLAEQHEQNEDAMHHHHQPNQNAVHANDTLLHISLRAEVFKDLLHELSSPDLDGAVEIEMIQSIKEIMSKLNALKGLYSMGNKTVSRLSSNIENMVRSLQRILLSVRGKIAVVLRGIEAKSKIVIEQLQAFPEGPVALHVSSSNSTLADAADVAVEKEGNLQEGNVSESMQRASEIMKRSSDFKLSESTKRASLIMKKWSDAKLDPCKRLWRQAATLCDFETCVLGTFLQEIEDAVADVLHAATACGHAKAYAQTSSPLSTADGGARSGLWSRGVKKAIAISACKFGSTPGNKDIFNYADEDGGLEPDELTIPSKPGQMLLDKIYGAEWDGGQQLSERHRVSHAAIHAWNGTIDVPDDDPDAAPLTPRRSQFYESPQAPAKTATFESTGIVTLSGRVANLLDTDQAPFLQDRLDVPFLWMPLVVPPASCPSPSNQRRSRSSRPSKQIYRQEALSMTVEEVLVDRMQRGLRADFDTLS